MGDDDENVMPNEKPLDLGLAFDGTDYLDDLDEEAPPQDGAGEALDGSEGDDDQRRHDPRQAEAGQAREIILAESDDAGVWRTVGDPVPDARFPTMDLAFDYATRLNCRDFGKRFD